jgi:hypothetical protein
VNKRGDEPRSLLRRLLKKADERILQSALSSPSSMPGKSGASRRTSESSPVRPTPPEAVAPPPQLAPQPRLSQNIEIPKQISGIEERLQAEEALAQLREKTGQIAAEFAEGKLNRAQFTALYAYFNERRVIIERLLARDPGTQAWQQVAKPGHTGFLRQHFEARVLAYSIYNHGSDDADNPLTTQGSTPMSVTAIKPLLTALNVLLNTHNSSKPLTALRKQIDNGRWITMVPGSFTTGVALFSLEPSVQQFTLMQDIHRDFERANHVALERGIRLPDQLVFPHRALFEHPGEG